MATNVRRGIGHDAYCGCGWISPVIYRTRAEARKAAHDHRLAELGQD